MSRNKLGGFAPDTPWHIGYTKCNDYDPEYDIRRHRSRCMFYDKESKKCDCLKYHSYYGKKCPGSAHCIYYKEESPDFTISLQGEVNQAKLNNKGKEKSHNKPVNINLHAGDNIVHDRFGKGTVVNVDRTSGYIMVDFNGTTRKLSYEVAKKHIHKA